MKDIYEHYDPKKKSAISQIVAKDLEDNGGADVFWREGCGIEGKHCSLSRGNEHLFVHLFSVAAFNAMKPSLGDAPMWQFAYSPNQKQERKVGFDLSLGLFRSPNVVQLQHKIKTSWCDSRWTTTYGKNRDVSQVATLVDTFEKSDKHTRPFFVWHVCFCLHEYRRMGSLGVPDFFDSKRTVIVDLSSLKKDKLTAKPKLTLKHDGKGNFVATCDEAKLKVLDFAGFVKLVKPFLAIPDDG